MIMKIATYGIIFFLISKTRICFTQSIINLRYMIHQLLMSNNLFPIIQNCDRKNSINSNKNRVAGLLKVIASSW